ncbi:MAG TPA: hypothetical protein VGK10_09325 [Prolixibacteraceae bacterium]|jgi:Rieske Fe-S protein
MNQYFDKGLKTILICFFVLAGINGCKDDYNSVVPYVRVYLDINLANRTELNPIGGFFKVNGGFGGIIVFHDLADSSNPFLAYDAACTYDLPAVYSVVAEEGTGVATCPKCGSQFILFSANGSPIKGPATEPLKQYQTTFSGSLISVRN